MVYFEMGSSNQKFTKHRLAAFVWEKGSAETVFSGYNKDYMNTRHYWKRSKERVAQLYVVGAFFLAFLLLPLSFASAENLPSGAFIIKPAKVELTLLPGESKTVMLTLQNGTPSPLLIDVSFEDIAARVQSSSVDDPIKLLGRDMGAYSLKDILSTPMQHFDLLSNNESQVPITIVAPKDALPGGRYGSVVFSFTPNQKGVASPATVAIKSRLAATIYLRIGGSVKEEGRVVAFGLFNEAKTVPLPSSERPLRFQVSFENRGDVHLNPYGQLSVSGMFGADHAASIDPWVVLPGATRMREIDVLDELSPGYYTARLDLNRGYQDIVDSQQVTFYVLPSGRQAFFGLLVTIFLLWLIRRSLQLSRHSVA